MESHIGMNDCIDDLFPNLPPFAGIKLAEDIKLWLTDDPVQGGEVMIFQDTGVIVNLSQLMPCCYQEGIIDAWERPSLPRSQDAATKDKMQ